MSHNKQFPKGTAWKERKDSEGRDLLSHLHKTVLLVIVAQLGSVAGPTKSVSK
jgi:hypothetical protein